MDGATGRAARDAEVRDLLARIADAGARLAAARADLVARKQASPPPAPPPPTPVAVPLLDLAAPLDHRTDVAYGARR